MSITSVFQLLLGGGSIQPQRVQVAIWYALGPIGLTWKPQQSFSIYYIPMWALYNFASGAPKRRSSLLFELHGCIANVSGFYRNSISLTLLQMIAQVIAQVMARC